MEHEFPSLCYANNDQKALFQRYFRNEDNGTFNNEHGKMLSSIVI